MDCFLSPKRVRTILQCISFGAILLWILSGAYVRSDERASTTAAARPSASGLGPAANVGKWGALTRHLLSTSEDQEEDFAEQNKTSECVDRGISLSGVQVSLFTLSFIWLIHN